MNEDDQAPWHPAARVGFRFMGYSPAYQFAAGALELDEAAGIMRSQLRGGYKNQVFEILAPSLPLDFELRTRGFNWINEFPRRR